MAHLARQVHVTATELGSFDFASRTAKRRRTEIRAYTGFRECSVADAEALAGWLAEHVTSGERRPERVREELILRCRAELIEPPTPERVSEIARSALHQAEQALLALIANRLDAVVVARLEALIAVSDDDQDENVLGLIKAAPGNVSLETMLVEISKLEAIRAIGLPADLFDGIDARIIAGWRARAAVESPVHLREHPQPTKLALLCALLYRREREVTDSLAQLLISTVHRINAHAEQKVVAPTRSACKARALHIFTRPGSPTGEGNLRGAVEREFGRLKHQWAPLPCTRGLDRVRLHAELTILAKLACALNRPRALTSFVRFS